jgi:hypothetical protein
LFIRLFCIISLLTVAGCASLSEDYATRFGLANPENPPIHPDLVDESYSGGTIDQQHAEEYDRKYHNQRIFEDTEPQSVEMEEESQNE